MSVLTTNARQLGEDGKVDEAYRVMSQVTILASNVSRFKMSNLVHSLGTEIYLILLNSDGRAQVGAHFNRTKAPTAANSK